MYAVTLKKTSTGEIRKHIAPDENWFDAEFMWTDGNYSCDCNRALYFARAAGEDDTEAWEQKCGDSAYKMISVVDGDGEVIWP